MRHRLADAPVAPALKGTIWTPESLPAHGRAGKPLAGARRRTVGVLALQGGVREHAELLLGLGASVSYLRTPADLAGPDGLRVDALVLPGGESSTIDRLLRVFGLFEPLQDAVAAGLPTLGTCAGLVLLARTVLDPAPGQRSLGVLDVDVRRNAFGSQVDSAEVALDTILGPARVAFIRAPRVERVGAGVEVLARRTGENGRQAPRPRAAGDPARRTAENRADAVVAVRQGTITGVSFHPELTGETLFHTALLRARQ